MDATKASVGLIAQAWIKCGAGQTKKNQMDQNHAGQMGNVMAIFTTVYQHVVYDFESIYVSFFNSL